MNTEEAKLILEREIARYRNLPQEDLLYLLHNQDTFERVSPSGKNYQLEFQAFWDNESKRDLRVRGCIDDGGWRALRPLCEDFIMREDGSFVGE